MAHLDPSQLGPWFFSVNRTTAEEQLAAMNVDAFLVRPSSVQSCFALSKYNAQPQTHQHFLIVVDSSSSSDVQGKQVVRLQDSQLDNNLYGSLPELVEKSPELAGYLFPQKATQMSVVPQAQSGPGTRTRPGMGTLRRGKGAPNSSSNSGGGSTRGQRPSVQSMFAPAQPTQQQAGSPAMGRGQQPHHQPQLQPQLNQQRRPAGPGTSARDSQPRQPGAALMASLGGRPPFQPSLGTSPGTSSPPSSRGTGVPSNQGWSGGVAPAPASGGRGRGLASPQRVAPGPGRAQSSTGQFLGQQRGPATAGPVSAPVPIAIATAGPPRGVRQQPAAASAAVHSKAQGAQMLVQLRQQEAAEIKAVVEHFTTEQLALVDAMMEKEIEECQAKWAAAKREITETLEWKKTH